MWSGRRSRTRARLIVADGQTMPVLQQSYNVPHFDAKGQGDQLFIGRGLPPTRLLTWFCWDNLIHFGMQPQRRMHVEEKRHNASLWTHYSDGELGALHGHLMASLPPQELMDTARWMVPALSPSERVALFEGMKAEAPPEAFMALVEHIRPHLDDAALAQLAPAIGVSQQPGLVRFR